MDKEEGPDGEPEKRGGPTLEADGARSPVRPLPHNVQQHDERQDLRSPAHCLSDARSEKERVFNLDPDDGRIGDEHGEIHDGVVARSLLVDDLPLVP